MMRLYNLGKVRWQESQLMYHALAELGWEALSLVSPATPYACIGFHQDVEQEIDLSYCHAKNIPIFRRDVGGGAVFLDGNQFFFQLILHKDHPEASKNKEIFYRKFLQPVINVYRHIGIPAAYKPVNDVLAGTKKITGTGVGEIGECIVFVGNLILDFNYEEMSKVLNVPDEKFRDKIHKTLKENLTTIRKELGENEASRWDEPTLNALMAEEFQKILGPMTPYQKDSLLQEKMDQLGARLMAEEWLFQRRKTVPRREVKIRAGLHVIRKAHKASGGLIRADYEVKEGRIKGVSVSGDFFCFPRTGIRELEERLEDQPVEEIEILLKAFYSEDRVETPGIRVQDWLQVFNPR
jgi:lipoate-protein ligase A